jgi:hypothetical protein
MGLVLFGGRGIVGQFPVESPPAPAEPQRTDCLLVPFGFDAFGDLDHPDRPHPPRHSAATARILDVICYRHRPIELCRSRYQAGRASGAARRGARHLAELRHAVLPVCLLDRRVRRLQDGSGPGGRACQGDAHRGSTSLTGRATLLVTMAAGGPCAYQARS